MFDAHHRGGIGVISGGTPARSMRLKHRSVRIGSLPAENNA
jgi:hypothetical protein